MRSTDRRRAMSAMEVLIVLAILGLLAAIIIPNFRRTRVTASIDSCACNLMWIEASKDHWARSQNKHRGDVPTSSELKPFMIKVVPRWQTNTYPATVTALQKGTNDLPFCPANGSYTIGGVGERPSCSSSAHSNYWAGANHWIESLYQRSYRKK